MHVQESAMKRFVLVLVLVLLFAAPPVHSAELSDNPAFCFGFIAMQSASDGIAVEKNRPYLESAFAAFGPKDSTDARGFDEWQVIGRDVAGDKSFAAYADVRAECRALIVKITQ